MLRGRSCFPFSARGLSKQITSSLRLCSCDLSVEMAEHVLEGQPGQYFVEKEAHVLILWSPKVMSSLNDMSKSVLVTRFHCGLIRRVSIPCINCRSTSGLGDQYELGHA